MFESIEVDIPEIVNSHTINLCPLYFGATSTTQIRIWQIASPNIKD